MVTRQLLVKTQAGWAPENQQRFIKRNARDWLLKRIAEHFLQASAIGMASRFAFGCDTPDAQNRPFRVFDGKPIYRVSQMLVPPLGQIDVLVSEDEDIGCSLANAGIVSRAGGGKAAHDLEVMGAGNARGTSKATLEDGLVVRRCDERPVHGRRCSISALPISTFCFRIRSGEHADAVEARGLAQNRINDAVGEDRKARPAGE